MRILRSRIPGPLGAFVLWAGLVGACGEDLPGTSSAASNEAPEPAASAVPAPPSHEVTIETDQADAVLAILESLDSSAEIADSDWQRLIATEGYRRLQARELAMGREFSDAAFREFLLSGETRAAAEKLASTVASWKQADLDRAASRALAYLPAGSALRATLYPVIKPQGNSFVFEVDSDPAIFLFVDPEVPRPVFENTLAHELHHIGYAAACEDPGGPMPEGVRASLVWAGAFGEGLAMLAAAGGPEIHPHAASKAEDRDRWNRDVARFEPDLRRVEIFFLDVIEGRLETAEIVEAARSFFGVQGPWYTVGWKMAATIEEVFGRDRLIDVLCDPRLLLATYNEAAVAQSSAGEELPVWSPELLAHWQVDARGGDY